MITQILFSATTDPSPATKATAMHWRINPRLDRMFFQLSAWSRSFSRQKKNKCGGENPLWVRIIFIGIYV
jgi:hypothetical protein